MAFLGLDIEVASKGLRKKRFFAFIIDLLFVLILCNISYWLIGIPNFFAVSEAMDLAKEAGSNNVELNNSVFSLFNEAYVSMLIIWFIYDVINGIFLKSSLGKLIFGLKLYFLKEQSQIKDVSMLIVRSSAKFISLYLFQGLPFFICQLTTLTNRDCQSGFDKLVKMKVDYNDRGK